MERTVDGAVSAGRHAPPERGALLSRWLAISLLFCLAGYRSLAWAGADADLTVVVDEAPDVLEASPWAVTTVVVDERLPASAEVADVVDRAPGAVIRRLGGPGDWAAVSLRGASLRQTEVLVEGVSLNPDGVAAVNLSELPLAAFDRVDVYRGGAPDGLTSGAIGGVVNLVSGDRPVTHLSTSYGSFGTGRVGALVSRGGPHGRGLVAAQGSRSAGRYRWFDDASTRYVTTDDVQRRRENNDVQQLTAHAVGRAVLGRWELVGLQSVVVREAGVPGPVGARTSRVRFGTRRVLAAAEARRGASRMRLWGAWREERLDDRYGEIGVGAQRTRDTATSLGVRAVQRWAASGAVAGDVVVDLRRDTYAARDALTADTVPVRGRGVGRVSASADVHVADDRGLISPTLGAVAVTGDGGAAPVVTLEPRLAARWRAGDAAVLHASVGRYLRLPDLVERYGDRGAFVGRPDLRPERGVSGDVGVRVALPNHLGAVEAGGFWSARADGIVYVQNAQRTAIPLNLSRARVLGVELASSLKLGPLLVSGSATATSAVNRSDLVAYAGKQLPRVPRFEGDASITWPVREDVVAGYTVSHVSGAWLDATNWWVAPGRTLHGAFVRVQGPSGLSVEVGVTNLLDLRVQDVPRNPLDPADSVRITQAVTDFAGYPLPGRALLVTLRWTP